MRARLAGLLTLAVIALALGAPAPCVANPPQVAATWVSDVKATSANLRAEINPGGLSASYHFDYIADAAYQANGFTGAARVPLAAEAPLGSGSANVAVLQHIGGLKPSTSYRYRVLASNSETTTLGPPRTLTTEENAPVFSLPDARGWELVSPPDKGGGAVTGFGAILGGGVLQASADGNAATFSSDSAFADPLGAPPASQYLSRRFSGGWSTENIDTPLLSGGYDDSPGAGVPYQLFSLDLDRGLLLSSRRCAEAEACPRGYYVRDNEGAQALTPSPERPDLRFAGAAPDLEHVVISTCAALTAAATEVPGAGGSCDPANPNLYLWSGSSLTLVNALPGASLAAQSRAISDDGSRVYFTEAGNLYLRAGEGITQVDDAAEVGGGGAFQTASLDGSQVFFTKAGHLYRYDATTEATTDLTPAAGVQGVLGASDDGSYVYYLAAGGLFLFHGGITVLVAAQPDVANYPPATGVARLSPDGTHLAFVSSSSLTGFDNTDAASGQPDSEVYLYDAAAVRLICASCNPSGERPIGPATIPGASANGTTGTATQAYKPRALSIAGTRLFFDSYDALVPQDTNADRDVYQWEEQGTGSCHRPTGCTSLISSGHSEDGASFVDAGADGAAAFFLTDGSLVSTDPGSVDLYAARIGGGFSPAAQPLPCVGDACQPLPSPPEDPAPSTLFTGSAANPPVVFPKTKPKKHHKKHRHQKTHHKRRGHR